MLDLNLENIHAKIALTLLPMFDGKTDVELFRIEDISYKIGSVSFKTDETKHSFLYGLLHPIIKAQIKSNTQKQLESATRDALLKFQVQLIALKRNAIRAYDTRMLDVEVANDGGLTTADLNKPLPVWSSEKFTVPPPQQHRVI